jgi:hypothetical protein
MKNKILTFLLIAFSTAINAQTIFGKWHSKNNITGKIAAVIKVYEKDGKAFAKIIEIKDPKKQNTVCNLCEGDNKGKKNWV